MQHIMHCCSNSNHMYRHAQCMDSWHTKFSEGHPHLNLNYITMRGEGHKQMMKVKCIPNTMGSMCSRDSFDMAIDLLASNPKAE